MYFFFKPAINSFHWLGFPLKVITSIGGNCRDRSSWWSAFITVRFARLLMGSTVSSPSTSLSINSSISSAKRLILSDEVLRFVFPEVSGVSRRLIKDSWSLKDGFLSLLLLLWLNSTLGKFLTLFASQWMLSEHTVCDKYLECTWSKGDTFFKLAT